MLLLSFLFGVLMGNYATTFLFRLPRGIEICGINKNVNTPPHCAQCKHKLRFYEYLPILSWIFSRFRCNYCGIKINPQYFFLEFSTGFVSIILYLFLGLSEKYLLLLALWVLSLLGGIIHLNHRIIIRDITKLVVVIGMIYRTLTDQSILPFMIDLSISTIVASGALAYRKWKKIDYRDELIHIILQGSIWLGIDVIYPLAIYGLSKNLKYGYFISIIFISCVTILKNII